MSEPTKMRCRYTDDELRWLEQHTLLHAREAYRELLAYRARYGDIDAPPRTLCEMHNAELNNPYPCYKVEDFIEAGRKIQASMQPDAPPKSPQPVAGGCEWLGDCEPSERAKLLDDIAILRAEVDRRSEVVACEVRLRESAEGERAALSTALVAAKDELVTAKAEAARYRAAIVGALMNHDVPPSVRILIDALMPNEEVF